MRTEGDSQETIPSRTHPCFALWIAAGQDLHSDKWSPCGAKGAAQRCVTSSDQCQNTRVPDSTVLMTGRTPARIGPLRERHTSRLESG